MSEVVILAEARLAKMRAASRQPIVPAYVDHVPEFERMAADEMSQAVLDDNIFEDFDGLDDTHDIVRRLYALDRMISV